MSIFHDYLYQPLLNLLVFLYNTVAFEDLGFAILIFTLITRILLFPLFWKQIKSQKNLSKLRDLQPKLKKIQEKYKNDPTLQSQKVMEFYRKHNINPLGSCLPLLIQLPILIALFQVMRIGLKPESLKDLYPFIDNPGELNPLAFGFINLTKASPIIALLAGGFMFLQTRMMTLITGGKKKKENNKKNGKSGLSSDVQAMTGKQLTYVMPVIFVLFYWNAPAGVPFYFTITTLFSIAQQYFMLGWKKKSKKSKKKKTYRMN